MTVKRCDMSDVGLWIDGATRGDAETASVLVLLANSYGYALTATEYALCRSVVSHGYAQLTSDADVELWSVLIDAVEVWLNDTLAPAGCAFGWHSGDFFLQTEAWWAEEFADA